jgi:putative flippase GtrA
MSMSGESGRLTQDPQHVVRHGLGFLLSGIIALSVDAVVLTLLTALLAIHPIPARLAAISLAMVAGWLSHRTFTFAVSAPPSVAEFLRYAGVGWTAAAINYGLFVAIILARPETAPLIALVASSLVATVFAYIGMRFGAFRDRSGRRDR